MLSFFAFWYFRMTVESVYRLPKSDGAGQAVAEARRWRRNFHRLPLLLVAVADGTGIFSAPSALAGEPLLPAYRSLALRALRRR